MTALASHPQRNSLRLQLRENYLLRDLRPEQWAALEPLLAIGEYRKGEPLVRQGDEEMEQFFILEGMVKRVVSNPEGHEMILRFAAEREMDTSYAAWRLRTPIPYSIMAVTRVRVAELPMPQWVDFLDRHADVKARFEFEVMKLMSEVMAHTITLHLLDAPGRLARFHRKHPELVGRIPKKELAAYLNLTPETLSRLTQKLGRP
ncbi:MAG: Crp/Fnr family transcriptional regulator [Pseudomonadota bacterium]